MKKYFVSIVALIAILSAYAQSKPGLRAHHELVYDEKNKTIILTAGSTPLNGGSSFEVYNDLWSFDGKSWKQLGTAGDKRSGIKMAFDTKRNKLFSFGGWSDTSRAELRVLENGDWKILSNSYEMKASEPGFVYDSNRDKLVAFGGSANRGVVNSITWEWDGSAWKKFEGKGPEGRQAFAMIYDSKRKKTILYGGMDGAGKKFNDGIWEFDGVEWKNIPNTELNPGSRISAGYTYDSKRGLLIIFGGISNDSRKGDTWAWDGTTWKQLAETGPEARAMGHLAYDKTRDRVVLFGGRISWPKDADDTWEWDGSKWSEIR